MKTKTAAVIAVLFALVSYSLVVQGFGPDGYSDLLMPLCSARAFLQGQEPYTACSVPYRGHPAAAYPLWTILLLTPFSVFSRPYDIALVWGLANGLLMYAILRRGEYHRLLIFASSAYWFTMAFQQWGVLLSAIMLLPGLTPLALVKPQNGLPIILAHLTRKRLDAITVIAALSLVAYPAWPFAWLAQSSHFDGVIPLLFLPIGPLLLVGLFGWRDKRTSFVLLQSLVPQRGAYDLLPFWTLTDNWRETLALTLLSWLGPVVMHIHPLDVPEYQPWVTIPFLYLPMLLFCLARVFTKVRNGYSGIFPTRYAKTR